MRARQAGRQAGRRDDTKGEVRRQDTETHHTLWTDDTRAAGSEGRARTDNRAETDGVHDNDRDDGHDHGVVREEVLDVPRHCRDYNAARA